VPRVRKGEWDIEILCYLFEAGWISWERANLIFEI